MDPGIAADLERELPAADFIRVLEMFREEMQQVTGVIEQAAHAGDGLGFRRAAHMLAGAAGSVGASSLEAASRQAMASKDQPEALPGHASEIRRLCNETLAALDAVLARVRPA